MVVLAAVTVALSVVSAVLPAVTSSPLTTGRGELRLYLDVLEESNLPTWWATAMLLLAATASGAVAALSGPGRQRRRWGVLTALVLLLSLDEMTSLHERLDRLVAGRLDVGDYPFLWLLPGAVLGAAVLVTVLALVRSTPVPVRRWLVVGFALVLASALGGEFVQGLLLAEDSTGPAYVLTYHAEETGETLGAIALLAGALRMIDRARRPDGVLVSVRRT